MLSEWRCVLIAAVLVTALGFATIGPDEGPARAAEGRPGAGGMCSRFSESAWSELHWSAWKGESRKVRSLLRRGHPVDDRVDSGEEVVAEALAGRLEHFERHVFGSIGSVGGLDRMDEAIEGVVTGVHGVLCEGAAALHLAALKGHVHVMRTLIRRGADPDARTTYGLLTAMDMAAMANSPEAIRLLHQHGGSVDVEPDSRGPFLGPLHWAALYGNEEAARELLELGANVNARTKAQEGQLFRGRHTTVTPLDILQTTILAFRGGHTKYGGVTPMDFLIGRSTDRGLRNLLGSYGGRCAMNCDPDAAYEGFREAGA